MSRLRTAGAFLLLAGIFGYLGQLVAAYLWQGIYSLEYNLISDLGVTQCLQINDVFLVRYACSPGFWWFSGGFTLAGLALLLAAVQILRSTRDALGRTLRGTGLLGGALLVAAAGMIVAGAVAYNIQNLVHGLGIGLILVGFWVALAGGAWASIRANRAVGKRNAAPVLTGMLLPVTLVLLLVSVVGVVLVATAPEYAPVGLYLRIALDPLWLWLFAVGASLVSKGSKRRQQAREQNRADRVAEREARDAAVRQAAKE